MGRLSRLNTLRNQILLGFMLVMLLVLTSVGLFVFNQVSVLLRNNAEKHIQQTAAQAAGKLEVLLRQIDSFTAQVATNPTVQRLLEQEAAGHELSFQDRQLIQQEVRQSEAYTTGVRSIELYNADYRMLLPLTDEKLVDRIKADWILRADEGKGRLVWLGMDPRYPNVVVAMRHVRLIDSSFSQAGYVLVQIEKSYFELSETPGAADGSGNIDDYIALLDEQGGVITSDFANVTDVQGLDAGSETVVMGGEEYIAVRKQSEATGWSILMLTPVRYATEGISVLRTAVLVSVMVGGLLFLLLSLLLSTMIARPIMQLIRAMRTARLGGLKPIPVTSSTLEINELNHTYNQLVAHLNELIEVVYQKEIIQSRTELKALQAQINPHFLFNTLEAFYWALEDKGEEELAGVVVAMSGLFRYVISRADEEEWVTIGDELDHAERYLKIMDMRMMDRLSWRIEADEASRAVPIPKLLVQPLVENAILHGVEQKLGQGNVKVSVKPSDKPGYTLIEVTDDGPGMSADKIQAIFKAFASGFGTSAKGSGIGLANVQKRLQLYYEDDIDGLAISSEPGKGTVMAFEIPNVYGGNAR